MNTISLDTRLDREIRYNLRRCPKLTDAEMRLLGLVASFKHGCLKNYDKICEMTGWSRAKLKRVVTSLINYGLLERTYRAFKKVTLRIAPARVQKQFADTHAAPDDDAPDTPGQPSDGSLVSQEPWLAGEPVMAHQRAHEGSPMSQPMLETDLERKIEPGLSGGGGGQVPDRARPGDVHRLMAEVIRKRSEQAQAVWDAPKPTQRRANGA